MTKTQSETLLYSVLRKMRFENDQSKRYDLQQIGESLIGEYRDLDYKKLYNKLGYDEPIYNG